MAVAEGVLINGRIVIGASHCFGGIKRLGTLKVKIRFCLVGLCSVEFGLRSIKRTRAERRWPTAEFSEAS